MFKPTSLAVITIFTLMVSGAQAQSVIEYGNGVYGLPLGDCGWQTCGSGTLGKQISDFIAKYPQVEVTTVLDRQSPRIIITRPKK